jgi:DNA repair photolyase
MKIAEITCKTAIGPCGFPGGGLAINPYIGCEHACSYCYARFIKRFTGHSDEEWGTFVDVRKNSAKLLVIHMKNPKLWGQQIYLSSMTDPYQPLEKKYELTREILKVLINYDNPVSIMTKSALVLRDIDLIKQLKKKDVNFTFTTLDEKWRKFVEPYSSTTEEKLEAMKKIKREGIQVNVMIGPYWPEFTDIEKMMKQFKEIGVSHIFAESFNSNSGNWTGVEEVLAKDFPEILPKIKEIFFDDEKFNNFYVKEKEKLEKLSKDLNIPATIYFASGHAANKFN